MHSGVTGDRHIEPDARKEEQEQPAEDNTKRAAGASPPPPPDEDGVKAEMSAGAAAAGARVAVVGSFVKLFERELEALGRLVSAAASALGKSPGPAVDSFRGTIGWIISNPIYFAPTP